MVRAASTSLACASMRKSIWVSTGLSLAVSTVSAGCGAGGSGASSKEIARGRNISGTGALLYERNCQHCHGENGEGDKGPAVLGRKTLQNTDFSTAQNLFDYLAEKMPADNPGSLDIGQYWNLTTFMVATMGKKIPGDRLSESNAEDIHIKKK